VVGLTAIKMGRNFRKNNFNSDRRVWQDHDDRGFEKGQGRIKDRLGQKQVGFVDGPRGGTINKRSRGPVFSKALNHIGLKDLDVDLEVKSEQAGRGRPVHGMRRGYRGKGSFGRHPVGVSVGNKGMLTWSKVTLRNGAKYDKVYLLKELLARSSVKFVPICYQTIKNNAIFFVEEQEAGKAIKDLDTKIELPDGYDLVISVDRTTPPNVPVSDDLVSKMKVGMSDRYNSETSALNLNSFHKSFAGESFFAPLWRTNILSKVVEIITDNIPEVKAIDLSSNKLNNLDAITNFKKLNQLNLLYLKDNKLTDLRGLEKLKGISLVELNLEGNPLKEKLGSSYTDSVRKTFPSLQVLDGKVLPKKIGFDDESSSASEMPLSCSS